MAQGVFGHAARGHRGARRPAAGAEVARGTYTPRTMAFSSVPENSDEGRAFLQQRLALFGKSTFFFFVAVIALGMTIVGSISPGVFGRLRAPPYHITAVLGVGIAWLVCRRGERSQRVLVALDAAILVLSGTGVAMTLLIAPAEILPGVPATLGVTHLLIAHAIIVPTEWRWTLLVSALAAAPTVILILVVGADGLGTLPGVFEAWSGLLALWCGVAAVVAAWTSHVIFGLRRRVVEARKLGQYTLEERIGEGGMGVVYRARHAMLRRPTVVKLLPPEKAGDANLARFEREVQHTSLLSSPNTVAVFDYGRTPDGTFYYAMELLDGIDLEKLVADAGPQPPARVIHILAQVCAALAEAHEAGLVHRDVKPGNIMLCRHGGAFDVAKVLDFGLVKDLGDAAAAKLSHAGALLGTPLYLSPEALSTPEKVDARADLYAVGAVGYFLATGRPVFEGRTIAELCAHHLCTTPEPPSTHHPVPADLEAVILACLEKSPAARPPDARTLRARLLACAGAGGWTEADARAWWRDAPPRRAEPPVDATMPTVALAARAAPSK
jgi:eukaryotic-like serine/threonine-protein kinase